MTARYAYAEKMAEKLLRKYPHSKPPIDVHAVAKGERLDIEVRHDWPQGLKLHGLVQGRVIGVNGHEPWVRQRFTVAHEVGHFALGHRSDRRDVPTLDQPDVDDSPYPAHLEQEANWFANALLVPKVLLAASLLEHRTLPPLAAAFAVSQQVLTIALDRTKLLARLV